MAVLLAPADESELKSLWLKRAELGQSQWQRLWHLVYQVLARCNPAVLRDLPDDKQDYITEFFLAKVHTERFSDAPLTSAAALCTFFQRFLIDVQRRHIRRATETLDDEAALDRMAEDADDDHNEASCESGRPDEDAAWRQTLVSAHSFYETLDTEDQLYLSLHTCDPDAEPLSKLAARYRIASYHYRAGQLGITRKKGELPPDYEKTRIGRWMKEKLGLSMRPDSAGDILSAFRALCEAAIALRETLLGRLQHA